VIEKDSELDRMQERPAPGLEKGSNGETNTLKDQGSRR
jgi:hypothetical protein